jgi:ABC-2 type transport system permease protein
LASTSISKPYISEFSAKANWGIAFGVFKQRTKQIMRYKGALVIDMLSPILFSLLPILLGISTAGSLETATDQFSGFGVNTTADFILFMLVGSNMLLIINGAIFNFGFFLRREQITGTLESLYLAPISQIYVLIGTALYAIVRALVNFFFSISIAALLFGVNIFQALDSMAIAILFLIAGMIPIYGLALGFGALVLKFKDMDSIQGIVTMIISILMGAFYPIKVFPRGMQYVSFLIPATWQNNGVKAALTGTTWLSGTLGGDISILLVFAILYPIIGMMTYLFTERTMRKTEGLGGF